jgi:hypothetical protein
MAAKRDGRIVIGDSGPPRPTHGGSPEVVEFEWLAAGLGLEQLPLILKAVHQSGGRELADRQALRFSTDVYKIRINDK